MPKVALVTGAAQGMGAACAARLEADGVRVFRLDVGYGPSERDLIAADVTKAGEVDEAVARVLREAGRVDILVNAAGVLLPTSLLDMEEAEWDWVVAVNLKGSFLTSRAAARAMVERGDGGRIIHFSSTAGKTVSTIGGCHYTAAKHGVLGLTRALAKELGAHGITVNAVCPGLIDTEMVRETIPPDDVRTYERSFPIPRLGAPEEVADLVAFIASEKASYITGAALDINGGDFLA